MLADYLAIGQEEIVVDDDDDNNDDMLLGFPGSSDTRKRSRKRKKNDIDPVLQDLLDDCMFYLTIKKTFPPAVKDDAIVLGLIKIEVDGDIEILRSYNQVWLYVSEIPTRSFLYTENDGEVKYFYVRSSLDTDLFTGLMSRCFGLEFDENEISGSSIYLRLLLFKSVCSVGTSLQEAKQRNFVIGRLCNVDLTVPYDVNDANCNSNFDLETLYSAMKGYSNIPVMNPIQHRHLVPILRPYQQCAVQWMLDKETSPLTLDTASVLFKEVAAGSQVFYYNKYDGSLSVEKPVSNPLPKGGILADEMGLGKTVEVLALILLNPNPNFPSTDESKSEKTVVTASVVEENVCTGQNYDNEDHLYVQSAGASTSSVQNARASIKSKVTKRPNKKKKIKDAVEKVSDTVQGKKRKPKSLDYQSLEKWYNEMLSETVRRVPASTVKTSIGVYGLKCVCGQDKRRLAKIQCSVCADWQHMKCMGFPSKEGYTCPQCWMTKDHINSGATLIVSPASISNQWLTECQKHIKDPNFKVLVYRGVQDGFLQPTAVAKNHIVLTTYEILRKELVHADVSPEEQPRLRHSKRFCIVPSPLTFVNWWRVCLDEAQMVENTTSKPAEMARRLNSVHRWAITGTPIQKTVQDLFGLIQFLGVEPYNLQHYWTRVLYIPYCLGDTKALFDVLKAVMWRTMKRDVVNEIGIPCQIHTRCWLHFSPVEEHFYRLQHTLCLQNFILMSSKFDKLNTPLKTLSRTVLNKLLLPLLRLRQACSHHQVVRGFQINQKATMTMEELLESLIKKTKVEAEEGLRKNIAALNGIAGINIIKELWAEAAECYREVLRLQEQYKDTLKSDMLQSIHTLYNLAEILSTHAEEIPPTLRDHLLNTQAKELEETYMNKQDTQVASAYEILNGLKKNVEDLELQFENGRDIWWLGLVMWVIETDDKGEFLLRVQTELLDSQIPGQTSIINRIKTLPALEHQLTMWSDSLFTKRKEAFKNLKNLSEASQLELANEAVECHLRSSNISKQKKKKCRLCSYDIFLKEYESILFAISSKQTQHSFVGDVMIMSNLQQGTWQASEQEKILKVLLSHGRAKRAAPDLLEEGTVYLKVLEGMKKEFKQLRYTWTQIRDQTSVRDELHMAKLRVRLRFEDEPVAVSPKKHNPLRQLSSNLTNKMETIHVIESHEIEAHAAKFQTDKILAEAELRRKFGQLQYLKNLEKNKGCKLNPDLCPICRTELGEKWSVLQCGHCFCIECIRLLMQSNGFRTINVKCPICRDITHSGEISFVDISMKSSIKENCPEVTVDGSYSTKVEAVVRCLLTIKAESNAKALVFSTWERVLDVLETALSRNYITYRRLQSGPKYKENLQQFKESSAEQITVLLIPTRLGSKGLNLIEATHVLLVEPMLNPADELQAVGRVHRIGQTKETTVHHFLVRSTVEERIYEATTACAEKWSDNCVTIQQLRDLFTCAGDMVPEIDNNNDDDDDDDDEAPPLEDNDDDDDEAPPLENDDDDDDETPPLEDDDDDGDVDYEEEETPPLE